MIPVYGGSVYGERSCVFCTLYRFPRVFAFRRDYDENQSHRAHASSVVSENDKIINKTSRAYWLIFLSTIASSLFNGSDRSTTQDAHRTFDVLEIGLRGDRSEKTV